MRRRNASSASDSGFRLVANTMKTLNGVSNLRPGVQRQEVDPALERHDPAVQQVARRNPLAAEVVDDEHAAVGLQLDRRLVELGDRVERQVQHLERQLAADHDHRPPDLLPPLIARWRSRSR